MIFIRIRWANPPVPGGRWHGGLINLRAMPAGTSGRNNPEDPHWRAYRTHKPHFSLRGLSFWLITTTLVVYLVGAAVLVNRFEEASRHNRITYLDLVLPHRWKNFDRLRGEALIAEGRELIRAKRFNDGFAQLRAGLSRHPADAATRLEVARIYNAMSLRPRAERLLREGLAHGYPGREYLAFALSLAAEAERFADRLELCRLASARFAEMPDGQRPSDASWLDEQTVDALLDAGRPDDALALATSRFPESTVFRRETTTRFYLENNRAAEALPLVTRWAAETPATALSLRLLAQTCRALGDHAGQDAALARLRALDPDRPEPLTFAILEHYLAGRPEATLATLDTLLFRHGADANLYFTLARFFGDVDYEAGLARLETEAAERGLTLGPMRWARFQRAVTRQDWPETLRLSRVFDATPGPAVDGIQAKFQTTVTLLAAACLDGGSGTQTTLIESTARSPCYLQLYKILLEGLLDAGRHATARSILTLAEGTYAGSPSIAALRARMETEASEAVKSAAAVPDMAKDGAFVTAEAFEAEFKRLIAEKDVDGALGLLAALRRARPGWLEEAEARIEKEELGLRARGDDPLRLQLLARQALARDPAAPATLLNLARTLHGEKRRESAILLLREILRFVPDQPDALALLDRWQSRAEAALESTIGP